MRVGDALLFHCLRQFAELLPPPPFSPPRGSSTPSPSTGCDTPGGVIVPCRRHGRSWRYRRGYYLRHDLPTSLALEILARISNVRHWIRVRRTWIEFNFERSSTRAKSGDHPPGPSFYAVNRTRNDIV